MVVYHWPFKYQPHVDNITACVFTETMWCAKLDNTSDFIKPYKNKKALVPIQKSVTLHYKKFFFFYSKV